ncbi:hypothetical protein FJTKL_08817 [Diaporthe vaccinii]|uniref:Pyruvate decarboxylase n=1 Tax=Diaporthe vaccinii TaxID=105482 RepID=A0ABR4EQM1_9PEZI
MSEILVGEYLFLRLKQVGVQTVFGVPGDFELALLNLVPEQGLSWVGTPNELVGAYAADGYAREKGFGALVTTFGPGELSALCGIGGAFCENVPVLHIVGYPTRPVQASGRIIHHTLGDLRYDVGISEDVAYSKIPSSYLETKLVTSPLPGNLDVEQKAISAICNALTESKKPILLVDGGASRGSWEKFVPELVDALAVPVFTTTLGKGIVDESAPYYRLSAYIKPGDLVVTETGTSQFGFNMTTLPHGAKVWTQAVYGSIGYAAGVAAGASIAARETGTYKRVILITGEGSYTVERYFDGMKAAYNDVPMWDYGAIFQAMSPETKIKSFKVDKAVDLDALLSDENFQNATYPQCVDMMLGPKDLPSNLKKMFEIAKADAATKSSGTSQSVE